MKRTFTIIVVIIAVALLGGCGGSDLIQTEEGRIISGQITSAVTGIVTKAMGDGKCIGEVCGVRAYGSNEEQIIGEVEPATNRWRIRVRAGNWMFGFVDGDGNRLGYLMMNGITAVTVEDGDDVDLGMCRWRGEFLVPDLDTEGLGEAGIHTYRYRDRNHNGIPDDFEGGPDDEEDQFDVLFIRPFDGQLDVAPCRRIKIAFTDSVDELTIDNSTVLVALDDGTPVSGELTILQDEEYELYYVIFTPDDAYPLGSILSVTIVSGPEGVLSEAGDALLEDITISFTVREDGDCELCCHDPDSEFLQMGKL